jgi:hypothetical protein
MSQNLGSVLFNLIPEVILSQKCRIHMVLIRNGSGVMSIYSKLNKVAKKYIACLLRIIVNCAVTVMYFILMQVVQSGLHLLGFRRRVALRSTAVLFIRLDERRIRRSSSSLMFILRAYTMALM